jgi:hypothetical protein
MMKVYMDFDEDGLDAALVTAFQKFSTGQALPMSNDGECVMSTKQHLAEEARFSDSDSDSELRGRRAECR